MMLEEEEKQNLSVCVCLSSINIPVGNRKINKTWPSNLAKVKIGRNIAASKSWNYRSKIIRHSWSQTFIRLYVYLHINVMVLNKCWYKWNLWTYYIPIDPIEEYRKLPVFILEINEVCEKHDDKYQRFCKSHDCPCSDIFLNSFFLLPN
jgi:hypothetical protein